MTYLNFGKSFIDIFIVESQRQIYRFLSFGTKSNSLTFLNLFSSYLLTLLQNYLHCELLNIEVLSTTTFGIRGEII